MTEVNRRKTLFNKLTMILTQVRNHATHPLTYYTAVALQNRAHQVMRQCEEVQGLLIDKCADDSAVVVQESAFAPIEATFMELDQSLIELVDTLPKPASSSSTSGGSTAADVKLRLPTFDIQPFDGNYQDWLSFKDLFLATIDKSKLAPAQKLQYLKGKLVNEPANLVKNILITDANYAEAWKMLDERYSNEREIVFSLIDKLFSARALQSENPTELQSLMDNTMESLRALKVLKYPVDHWDVLIIATVLKKVDANTRREWAIRQTGAKVPTLQEFNAFITNHIRGLLATGTALNNNQQQRKRQGKVVGTHFTSTEQTCRICKGNHSIFKCDTWTSKTPKERSRQAQNLELCFNCLSHKHRKDDCQSQGRCKKCGQKHHTLLHEERSLPTDTSTAAPTGRVPRSSQSTSKESVSISTHFTNTKTEVLLSTAVVLVQSTTGQLEHCRVLLDSGSQASFISTDCSQRLGLKREQSRLKVEGISAADGGTTKGKVYTQLHSRVKGNPSVAVELHILPKISSLQPKLKCQTRKWAHLEGLTLADPDYFQPQRVDMLLGADYYAKLILGPKKEGDPNAPVALETIFGWVLLGNAPLASSYTIQTFHVSTNLDILKKFWEVEEPPKSRILTKEEKDCEAHFKSTHFRDNTGRFVVGIPFNSRVGELGSSRYAALKRFYQVEKRLHRQPLYKQPYVDFMREYEALGHMERIPEHEVKEEPGRTFYLPHHFVVNENSTTTKLRVVFDGSVKSSTGVSLNDAMLVGATLQDDLYFHLLRFRVHPITLKADITKMFRQFKLRKEDADFHRILWRESPNQPLIDYRLTTLSYGTANATNLSTRCVKQLAEDCRDKYPLASKALDNDTYVDDVITGSDTVQSSIRLYRELTEAVATAGLELRKWSTNSPDVLEEIAPCNREADPHNFDNDTWIKALGIQWHPTTDKFKFKHIPVTESATLTKRILLSDLARVFDPLGLITPVTIQGKLLLQELWKDNLEWDGPVPDVIQQQWNTYQEEMKCIEDICIPRCIIPSPSSNLQIHGFCDASEKAYGAAIYIRGTTSDGSHTSNLITSKSKVAPLRQVTLPRLELMGALLLAELVSEVQEALKLNCDIFLWTDSTITLRWISAQPRRWKTFVANRVAKIQECTKLEWWRHVPGAQNPADIVSRGVPVSDLISSSFWFSGPQWLQVPELPLFAAPPPPPTEEEERSASVFISHTLADFTILERFSSLSKLQRVTAYIFRVFFNAKKCNLQQKLKGPLSPLELHHALMFWIRKTQRQHYDKEISALKKTGHVQASSKLRSLYPFIDNNNLLRLSGRLHHSTMADEHKHQLIIPVNCHLTTLLLDYHHKLTLHGGFQVTWAAILARYWIPGGRNKTRHLIRSCVTCRRFRATAAEQLMGSLPASRVTPARPFLHCGVDYAGPFILKNPIGRAPKTYKGYMCLFVCMVTKAIHLEAVSSLTTEDFIAAFRRFTSRRGISAHVYSDRGSTFIGSDKELKAMLKLWESSFSIPDHMASVGVTWHWAPPLSPHVNGVMESGVKSAKFHLRRVTGNSVLTFEQFSTLLCQVEAILNSRPLYPFSPDSTDFNVLTPGHFLIGDPLAAVPDANVMDIPSNRLNLYKRQQQRVQHFWRRWSKDYLNTLQQRNKWWWDRPNLTIGDLVLLKEDTAPATWKMARVIATHPGEDGKVRVVSVKTATNSIFKRSTVKLIPLFMQ